VEHLATESPSQPTGERTLPLQGITVLDLGQIYNGPYAGFLMAMGGARVIKIEPPGGEKMRRRGSVGSGGLVPFAMLNSNKEFVTLNLKSDTGRELFRKMVCKADVVIENFAPGVMERLGVGPTVLMRDNPRLIYAAGSGYGWSGPYKDLLAMDLTVQAMSGVMASTGFPDRPPVKAGPALCDFFGGIHLYAAAITALVDAQRTGVGRFVEVSMLEAVYPALSSTLGMYYNLGNKNPPRTGNRHSGMSEAPYNVYPAIDGWVAMFCVSEAHFEGLAGAIGRPDLTEDQRFGNLKSRVAHMDDLDGIISEWTSKHTRAELFEIFNRYRVPCAPVREIDEVVNDPHMHSRGTLQHIDHPELGELVLPTGPLRYGDARPPEIVPSKAIGADNASVFQGWLGLSEQEFQISIAEGAFS
jgi:crotonobetainyl-CoA:carnitine CoA-transferase CaiB-like acyl-CoA transferase